MHIDDYLLRWNLVPDGDLLTTHSSRLLPVRRNGEPAMLKIADEAEEKFGGLLMVWWNGQGAARVLAHDHGVLLLERAEGSRSLAQMARNGEDEQASRIICDVIAQLHAPRPDPLPDLKPLEQWFGDLAPGAAKYGGILHQSAVVAGKLLSDPREITVLHGDIHHDNILDFGPRGWLVIDPKRLLGERGFDYANLFCNPDRKTALAPGRLQQRLDVVVQAAGVDRQRQLQWILAYAGLSAVWCLDDNINPIIDLAIAEIAAAELAKLGE